MTVRCRFAHFRSTRLRESTPIAFLAELPSGLAIVGLPASHFAHLPESSRAVARMLIEVLEWYPDFEVPYRACNGLVRYGSTFQAREDPARETVALYRRSL